MPHRTWQGTSPTEREEDLAKAATGAAQLCPARQRRTVKARRRTDPARAHIGSPPPLDRPVCKIRPTRTLLSANTEFTVKVREMICHADLTDRQLPGDNPIGGRLRECLRDEQRAAER